MRILDVKNTVPFPLDTGTNIASYQLLKYLSRRHDVSFFGLAHSANEAGRADCLREICRDVRITLAPNRKSPFHKISYKLLFTLNFLLKGTPYEESYSSPGLWKKAFHDHVRRTHYDLVIAEYWHNAWVFDHLPPGTSGALLVHDAAFINNERLLRACRPGVRKPFVELLCRLSKARERKAIRKTPCLLALSADDLLHIETTLTRLDGKLVEALPVLLPLREALPEEGVKRHTMYFVGSAARINNLDAVQYFCREILPHILRPVPEALFYIIGRMSEQTKKQFESMRGVKVLWHEGDISSLIADKGICVVPLRIGSGIKYKVLDGFSLGKPVVTTTVGAEGIDYYSAYPECIYDDPEAFARETVRLMQDDGRYREVRKRQLDFIRRSASPQAVEERLTQIVERIAEKK